MRVLVTGAGGFIGSHVCDHLVSRGDDVVGLGLSDSNVKHLLDKSNFQFIGRDVTEDTNHYNKYDVVIHLAGQLLRESAHADYIKVNTLGIQRIIDACASSGTKNFVYASSASVYDVSGKSPLTEESCLSPCDRPSNTYAASKRAGELIGSAAVSLKGINFTSLRLFTVYGPRQKENLSVSKFTRLVSSKHPVPLYGLSSRDFIYIDDVVDAISLAINDIGRTEIPFQIFNVGTGVASLLSRVVQLIAQEFRMAPIVSMQPLSKGEALDRTADTYNIEAILGFKAKVSLEEGVRKYINWWKQNETERTY